MCEHGTLDPEKVNLVTGDCVEEMRKLPAKWFHTIVTSFPYWPARRSNHPEGKPIGIGFEAKWEDYVDNMVCNVGREEKRVLRDDGVMFVMMDDAIALPPLNYAIQTYQRSRNAAKIATQTGFKTQDSTYLRPEGNWLGLPHRYMMAMQNDGWICRDVIIIVKGAQGRKESSETRTRHNYEWCFMFVKRLDYYYDQDETRIPLTSMTPTSLVGSGSYQEARRHSRNGLPHQVKSPGTSHGCRLAYASSLYRKACFHLLRDLRATLFAARMPTGRARPRSVRRCRHGSPRRVEARHPRHQHRSESSLYRGSAAASVVIPRQATEL